MEETLVGAAAVRCGGHREITQLERDRRDVEAFSAELKYGGGRTAMRKNIGAMQIHDTAAAAEIGAERPIVRTHPDTGRKALYLSRSHTVRFKRMTEEESRPVMDYLIEFQVRP